MEDVLDTLHERGFVQDVSDEPGLRKAFASGPVTFYWGTDPTASSLTAGHLVSLMLLAHLQRAGHRPIVVVGGGTGLIGDPTGKTETRQLLSEADIEANLAGQRSQVTRYLDFSEGDALVLNNADWLRPLGYLEFLRDIGRHFSVNQLLQHGTYRERILGRYPGLPTGAEVHDARRGWERVTGADATGLNFIELNYALLQAFDFLCLFREHGCTLQVGGNDQWFNILAGVDLIRRAAGGQAYALVTPLLSTSTGEKMGKTAGNALWLDPQRTSPYDFYQYWINIPDPDVERFLALFTFVEMDEVRSLGRLRGADLRKAKEKLAFEATKITHGEEGAIKARDASRALFGWVPQAVATMPVLPEWDPAAFQSSAAETPWEAIQPGVPTTMITRSRLEDGIGLIHLLVETGLADSKRAARDLIRQGGAYVNGRRAEPGGMIRSTHLQDGAILLRAGKKHYHRVIVER